MNGIEVNDRMYQFVEDKGNDEHYYKCSSNEKEEEERLNAQLSVAMLDVYNNRLKARYKRKRYE